MTFVRAAIAAGIAGSAAVAALPARAADLASAPILRTDAFSAELFTGLLSATAIETVYDVPGTGQKVSQLNWQIDRAAILGGRFGWRANDWLSLRAEGWTAFASSNAMDDFDWLFGYSGFNSWSDWSHHRDTGLPVAYRLDGSAAARFAEFSGFGFEALAGLRYDTMKWDARGGHYVYSTNGFRDDVGDFAPGEPVISYRQWWVTPYLGLAVTRRVGRFGLRAEALASPFAAGHDRDYHLVDVQTIFKERFSPTAMLGLRLDADYALTPSLSATAGVEYDKIFEAKGGTLSVDYVNAVTSRQPKPSAGAGLETMLVRIGLKETF